MNDYKFFPIFLATFVILVPIVIAVNIDSESNTAVNPVVHNATGRANGEACDVAAQCFGGYCNSGSCASSAPSTSSPGGGSSETTTTTPTTTTPATTTPTVTPPTPVPVTPIKEIVTDTTKVNEIIKSIKPGDLGVAEVKPENVEVTKTGVAESATTIQAPILESVIEQVLLVATEAQAQQALTEIKQSVSSGSSTPVSVMATLEVFEVKEKATGQTSHVSKITLVLKPEKDLKDVNIVEIIPKSVAASILEVIFLGEQPIVLQADPIVQWEFAEVKKDETKDMSYQVNKKIESLGANTVAVAEAPAEPAAKPSLIWVYIIIGISIAAAIGYVVYKKISPTEVGYSYRRR